MNAIHPEYQRRLDILSGLPGLGLTEQQAEIDDRVVRGDLVQVNEVWYQRVDLSAEAAAAVRRAVQARDEARPHDDEPVLGDVIKCQQCGRQTRSISRGCSVCGLGKPSVPDDEPCACCASGIIPVFEGPKCVRGLGPDGCGHSHEAHAGYHRG